MILEVAILHIKPELSHEFEPSFAKASVFIASIKGYIRHTLQRCLEEEQKYILLVEWEDLESHTVNFRASAQYLEWKQILHPFYDPFPIVEHYEKVHPIPND